VLEVSFTTDIARLISFKDDCSPTLDIESDEDRGDLHFDSEPLLDSNRGQKDVVVQQPLSSQSGCWTKVRHGGMTLVRTETQSPSTGALTFHTVRSGLVNLSVRPISSYQLQLLERIKALRSNGWTDRQIAKHFNDIGWLTPRGKQWLPQSVYSMRLKAARRQKRLEEG
jgi:hypothetical protein